MRNAVRFIVALTGAVSFAAVAPILAFAPVSTEVVATDSVVSPLSYIPDYSIAAPVRADAVTAALTQPDMTPGVRGVTLPQPAGMPPTWSGCAPAGSPVTCGGQLP